MAKRLIKAFYSFGEYFLFFMKSPVISKVCPAGEKNNKKQNKEKKPHYQVLSPSAIYVYLYVVNVRLTIKPSTLESYLDE